MAISDVGAFLPKESHFKTPGSYDKLLEAESIKRANYLSQMDQFYAQLEESQRQFDETLDFQVETRDLGLDLERDKFAFEQESFGKEFGLAEARLGFEKEAFGETMDLKNRQTNIAARGEPIHLGGSGDPMQRFPSLALGIGMGKHAGSTPGVTEREAFDFMQNYLGDEDGGGGVMPSGGDIPLYTPRSF